MWREQFIVPVFLSIFLKKEIMKPFIAEKLKEALIKKYEAEIADAEARLYVYFSSSVGIGEHPQHTEEMDNLVEQLTNANDKLETIKNFKIYEL